MELLVYILAALCLALLITVVHLMQIKTPKPVGTIKVMYDDDTMYVTGLYLEFDDRADLQQLVYMPSATFKTSTVYNCAK